MGLLERGAETAAIEELVSAATGGSGRALVLEGTAGIGKSVLLAGARELAAAAGAQTAHAVGFELESGSAFGAARQLLGGLVAERPVAERVELLAGAAAPAAAIIEDRPGAAPADPVAVVRGLFWLVANLAERAPLVLIVDDLQWFDPPSQRFVAFVARRLQDLPVSLLVGTRPVDAANDAVSSLLADPRARVLVPAPLSPTAVATVVARHWSGQPIDPDFALACHEAGGGNPFLTDQLIMSLREADVEPTGAAAADVLATGSVGAGRHVLRRVARLSPADIDLVRAIAVLGPDASIGKLARLVGDRGDREVLAAIETLARAGLVSAGQPVRFVHPLVRTAVYDDMAAGVSGWWHARAARMLAEAGASADRLASHLTLVEPDGDPWAVQVLCRAASSALERGAPDAAVVLYRRAMAEPPPRAELGEILLSLGSAERACADPSAVEHLSEAHGLLADPARRRDAAWELRRALVYGGRAPEAVLLFGGLTAAETDPAAQLRLEAATVMAAIGIAGESARVTAFGERVGALDPDEVEVDVAAVGAYALWWMGSPRARILPLLTSAFQRRLVEGVDTGARGSWWMQPLAMCAMATDHPQAAEMTGWLTSVMAAVGDLQVGGPALVFQSMRELRHEGPSVAAATADAALAIFGLTRSHGGFRLMAVSLRAQCHLDRGEITDAATLLANASAEDFPASQAVQIAYLEVARAQLRLAQGRPADAVPVLRAALARTQAHALATLSYPSVRVPLALALAGSGELAEARLVAGEAVALARSLGMGADEGTALRVVGMLAVTPEADAALRASVELLAGGDHPVEHARTLLELGRHLRRQGLRTDARGPLLQAQDLATRHGALAVAETARAELLAVGARPRRTQLIGVESLTTAEARTAELAADGCSNKQIAQAMFVSVKTVETHLAHAYQKLGISRRSELPRALVGAGS